LSGTVGSVLDPIAALRTKIKLEPGKTAHITFAFAIAETREEILKLADKYHDNGTYERTSILAWTESQIRLHYLGINHSEASLFQKLANRMVYLDPSLRPTSEILKRNNLNVTRLWAHGISGDNPIILLKINSIEERNIVRQLLMAQEYWKTKTLSVDLIILTEKSYSYSMELFRIIETMVNSNTHIHEAFAHKSDGKVFIFQSEMLQEEEIQLLTTISRVIINSKNGNLSEQIRRLIKKPEKHSKGSGVIKNVMNYPNHSKKLPELEFFNGIGGFIKSGK
jgi:cyclic beta-1,2-glucan synthetase